MKASPGPLGRVTAPDLRHVERYGIRLARPGSVEVHLSDALGWWPFYDQGEEGACVGFGCSRMMSILNRRRYDAPWLYGECKRRDGIPHVAGTYTRVALDVLRDLGHKPHRSIGPLEGEGIEGNRWARTLDDVVAAISAGVPVVYGCAWLTGFDNPEEVRRGPVGSSSARGGRTDYLIGHRENEGRERGGHLVCLAGASDAREEVDVLNSWGRAYPRRVRLSYRMIERQLASGDAEAGLVADRLPLELQVGAPDLKASGLD